MQDMDLNDNVDDKPTEQLQVKAGEPVAVNTKSTKSTIHYISLNPTFPYPKHFPYNPLDSPNPKPFITVPTFSLPLTFPYRFLYIPP